MTMNGEEVVDLMEALSGTALPESIDFAMRGDMADGVLYFQSAALAQLMEQPELADAWYSIDVKAMFDQMTALTGMDYAALMQLSMASLDMTFAEQLEVMLRSIQPTSVQPVSYTHLDVYKRQSR